MTPSHSTFIPSQRIGRTAMAGGVALLLGFASSLLADPLTPSAPDTPPPPPAVAQPKPLPTPVPKIRKGAADDRFREDRSAFGWTEEVEKGVRKASEAFDVAVGEVHRGLGAGLDRLDQQLGHLRQRPIRAMNPLVVPLAPTEGQKLKEMEEHLSVMGRVLGKVVGKLSEGASDLFPGGYQSANDRVSSGGPMYLEGYGAVFTFQVRFPLVASTTPAKASDDEKEDNAWREARAELFGGKKAPGNRLVFLTEGPPAEEYDATKVAALKRDLTHALKHASNMSHLASNEELVVVVRGPDLRKVREEVVKKVRVGPRPDIDSDEEPPRKPGEPRESVAHVTVQQDRVQDEGGTLMIRATKAVISAFAKGDLSAEEFTKQVKVVVY
ncbi:MAG: hypothetical protein FJ405_08155 [Verrucomicrobia bacterium]|nr:hypothetical protein [Verrucomicrobiota bacterium]